MARRMDEERELVNSHTRQHPGFSNVLVSSSTTPATYTNLGAIK